MKFDNRRLLTARKINQVISVNSTVSMSVHRRLHSREREREREKGSSDRAPVPFHSGTSNSTVSQNLPDSINPSV